MTEKQKKLTGFALLSVERRRELASMGGKAANEQGNAYKFTSETAKIARESRNRSSRRDKEPEQKEGND